MLRTNQSKITRSQPYYAPFNVSRNAFFSSRSSRALNKKSFSLILWQETNRNVVYRGLYPYRQQVRVITLFPNIFSYCFCTLSGEFANVFERKVWRVQGTFKSESVFSIVKDLCRYLWCFGKKTNRMSFSAALVNFTALGLIDMFLYRNCRLYIIIQKIAPQAESGKYFQIWFFPPIWGKMAALWACACKLSWISPARVQPL